jgi:hypothetical protein
MFVTRSGSWRFRRLAFGFCNAEATFQRVMDVAMHGLNFDIMLDYMDGIILYSSTVSEYIIRLGALFERLRCAQLKLEPSKCHLLREISFLGHVVSQDGVQTAPEKIKTVVEWPVSRNVHDVRSFLGLCSYYRRFVEGFAKVAEPLHALTGKKVLFK